MIFKPCFIALNLLKTRSKPTGMFSGNQPNTNTSRSNTRM